MTMASQSVGVIDFGAASTLGARSRQEDVVKGMWRGSDLFVALADGVGGRPGGEHAADSAVTAALDVLTAHDASGADWSAALKQATGAADRAVGALAGDYEAAPACTLVLAVFSKGLLHYVGVGDSHLLCFRKGELHILTDSQTRRAGHEETALLMGDDKAWKMVSRSGSRALTSAISGEGHFIAQPRQRKMMPGDVYLIASDGVETISFNAMSRAIPTLVQSDMSSKEVAQRIVAGIDLLEHPGQDNATVGIVAYGQMKPAHSLTTAHIEEN